MTVKWAKGLEGLLRPIDSVKPNPNNPNNGDVDSVIESIEINGFNQVITVDEKTGYIEAGHTRWAALHALGSDVAPFVFVDHDEAGMTRYLIADNQTGRKARMDKMQEAALLTMLRENTALGLAGTGFDDFEYQRLIEDLAMLNDVPPDGGAGWSAAPNNLYQVVITFEGDEDKRNELYDELSVRYPGITKAVNV